MERVVSFPMSTSMIACDSPFDCLHILTFARNHSAFFSSSDPPTALHSFPTRRSSDLDQEDPIGLEADRLGEPCVAQQVSILAVRSEEHTSELQSLAYLVCRLLLEKINETRG